jgi:hypothetical protein
MPKLLVPDEDALPPLPPSTAPPQKPTTPPAASPLPSLPPRPARMEGAILSYRARLSRSDHLNDQGIDLRTLTRTKFSEILLQERLHVHQGTKQDAEDSVDEEFAVRPFPEYRALFERKPLRMPSDVSLIQLLKDDVIVDVQVFDQFIQVDPVVGGSP